MPLGENGNHIHGNSDINHIGVDGGGCYCLNLEENGPRCNNDNGIYHNNSPEEDCPNSATNKSPRKLSTRYWQIGSVISCFIANFAAGGLPNSYGVMYTYMKEPLGTTEWQLSLIGSLMGGCIGFASESLVYLLLLPPIIPARQGRYVFIVLGRCVGFARILGTVCVDCLGSRFTTLFGSALTVIGFIVGSQMDNIYVLYFTLGVLPGIGVSLVYTATMVHVNKQFSKWRPLAVGTSVTGVAVGILTWPPLSAAVADNMGWRGTFLINGALALHFLPCALWITPRSRSEDSVHCPRVSLRKTIINCFKIYRLPGAFAFSIAQVTFGFCYYTFTTFLPDYVSTPPFNMAASEAALIVSSSGYGSIFGRLIFSGIVMVNTKGSSFIFLFSSCMCGITSLLVPLCTSSTTMHINSAVNGLAIGGWMGVFTLVVVELFGLNNLSQTFGMNMVCQGFGSFVGPPLQSYLATRLGKEVTFYSSGTSFLVTSILVMVSLMQKQKTFCSASRLSVETVVVGVDNKGFNPSKSKY
ncbi:monocarboxylate transporter 13-like [Haliotis cracherodii]|uniref:monocarboxylate transporter 13-like n=1 Tax=Haliotis cracherodii TaxID=6455 RepID=UPI0039EB2EBE